MRLKFEELVGVLKKRNIYEEILNELGSGSDLISGQGPTILEQYQNQLEQYRLEIQDKSKIVKNLQKDYEYLMTSSNNDIKRLEQKEQEIERLKRSVAKLQKEIADNKLN